MAPEVIACDENPDATYDNRVSQSFFPLFVDSKSNQCLNLGTSSV